MKEKILFDDKTTGPSARQIPVGFYFLKKVTLLSPYAI